MGGRLVLVAAALSLLLGACARPAAEPVAEPVADAAAAGTTAASCPTTRPPDPPFAPPAPYPATPPPLYGDKFWYGTDRLWTWLDADGTWPMPGAPGGVQSDKSFWWREGYDWQTETTPPLQVTARRLDAAAPPVTVSAPPTASATTSARSCSSASSSPTRDAGSSPATTPPGPSPSWSGCADRHQRVHG
jgi:hypothetical protein